MGLTANNLKQWELINRLDILYLPGNSKENDEWIEEISLKLDPYFNESHIFNYSHWSSGKANLDFSLELDRIKKLDLFNKDLVVFAKSAGVILACLACSEGLINPSKCVFVGSAINYGYRKFSNLDEIFRDVKFNALFIQNEFDPAINYSKLDLFLKSNFGGKYKLKKLRGSNHKYLEIEKLVDLSVKFFVVG